MSSGWPMRAEYSSERMADRIGQQIGDYRLERLLGSGGFAEVYLGQHVHIHTSAAIKFLKQHLSSQRHQDGFCGKQKSSPGCGTSILSGCSTLGSIPG